MNDTLADDEYLLIAIIGTPICGDGLRVGAEQCDDDNILVGDGCD